jgi:hypothetical protein
MAERDTERKESNAKTCREREGNGSASRLKRVVITKHCIAVSRKRIYYIAGGKSCGVLDRDRDVWGSDDLRCRNCIRSGSRGH